MYDRYGEKKLMTTGSGGKQEILLLKLRLHDIEGGLVRFCILDFARKIVTSE